MSRILGSMPLALADADSIAIRTMRNDVDPAFALRCRTRLVAIFGFYFITNPNKGLESEVDQSSKKCSKIA